MSQGLDSADRRSHKDGASEVHTSPEGRGGVNLDETRSPNWPESPDQASFGAESVWTETVDALERQKQQIGLELHDGVGQLLTAIRIRSRHLAETVKDSTAAREAKVLADDADDALTLLKVLTSDLSPPSVIRGDTLREALEVLVQRTNQVGDARCLLRCEGDVGIPDPYVRVHAYRIMQEALNNAIKHSNARRICVSAACEGQEVVLLVRDDGTGFACDTRGQSLGIESLRRRAHVIGADLRIESKAGSGTSVTCRIPIRPDRIRAPIDHRAGAG